MTSSAINIHLKSVTPRLGATLSPIVTPSVSPAASLEQRIAALTARFDAIETAAAAKKGKMPTVVAKEATRASAVGAAATTTTSSPSSSSSSSSAAADKRVLSTPEATVKVPGLATTKDAPGVRAVRQGCIDHGLSSAELAWVPNDYYQHPLTWRRDVLRAPSIHFLTKAILLENTHHDASAAASPSSSSPSTNSRYYCVMFQYTQRFDAELVMRFIKNLPSNAGLGKKKFNFRLASSDTSVALTGFVHNAVSPIGSKTSIPIIISSKILALQPPHFWLGGGHEDCKLKVDTAQFMAAYEPFVADFTSTIPDDELASLTG